MSMHRFRKLFAMALCTTGMLAAIPSAWAHAFLQRASPAVGSTVSAPDELRLDFTERVELLFSHVTVQQSSGAQVASGAMRTAQNGQELVLPLPKLPPGTYTVTWHVTSVDTHKTEGSFHFTVAQGS